MIFIDHNGSYIADTDPMEVMSPDKLEAFKRKFLFEKFKIETSLLLSPTDCYSVSDGTNTLYRIDKTNGSPITYVGSTGVCCIEAVTTSVDGLTIYAFDGANWGTLNYNTGVFNYIGTVGTGVGAQGTITFNDVDGVAIDGRTLEYFGSERQNDGSPNDLLFQFDPATGNIIEDAFGVGIDYVEINTSSLPVSPTLYDVDDMGIDPLNGQIYAVANTAGSNDRLVAIDKETGDVTDVGRITYNGSPLDDIESMSFSNDGTLFITSASSNRFYRMDKTDATCTLLGTFPSGSDFEGIACLTDGENVISGTTFFDYDYSTTYNGGDSPSANELVRLYEDMNNDNLIDAGDELIQSQYSDASGSYSFSIAIEGNFLVGFVNAGYTMTTATYYSIDFVGVGNTSSGNDFGFLCTGPQAVNDNVSTLLATSVDIDVLDNDAACEGLDPSSVTTTGVQAPLWGSITGINSSTGEITYLPNSGFTGIDSFQYIVCDLAPISLCDTAWVYVTVLCSGSAGQNDITGSVFHDLDQNGSYDAGETGEPSITIWLYEDDSPNDGVPDGAAIQTTTTDGSGDYSFTLYNSYSVSGNGWFYMSSTRDDAREKTDGDVEDDKDLEISENGNDAINGLRFTSITIPNNATITNAYIVFTAKEDDDDDDIAAARFRAQDDTATPSDFTDCENGCQDITNRQTTSNYVDWTLPEFNDESEYSTPDLSSVVQEVIDEVGGISNGAMVFVTQSLGPDYEERKAYAYNNSVSKAPRLFVEYNYDVASEYNYIVEVNTGDLDPNATMTTATSYNIQFTQNGTSACDMDFGFYLPPECRIIYSNGFIRYNRVN